MEKRLGKGLAQIIETGGQSGPNLVTLRTEQIRPCRYQPRVKINEAAIEELKASIQQRGIIQPVVVRPIAHGSYELVAGERRWRAAQAIGAEEIPAIVRALSDQETVEFSLIENVQREELNVLEEARAYARLVGEFGYTQEQVAESIGKNRASVANTLRMLKLSEEAQAALREDKITAGHAKALLAVESKERQGQLLAQTLRQGLSVRALEELVGTEAPATKRRRKFLDPHMKAIENALRQALGTKVSVRSRRKGGRVVIEYFSAEDLTRILRVLGVSGEA